MPSPIARAINYLTGLTAAEWLSNNPTPLAYELCQESDTLALKMGDGSTAWSSLPYLNSVGQETIAAAGAISVIKQLTKLALSGAGAVTLAAPGTSMIGQIKTIQMTADNGDVTLALTNVVGQSSGTTATFNDAGDALVLIGAANSKWIVLKEYGITLS